MDGRKVFSGFKNYLPVILVALFSVVVVIFGMFHIEKNEASWQEVVGSICSSIIIGITISTLLRIQAIGDARRTDEFKASLAIYAQSKANSEKYQDKLSAYCGYKNEQTLLNSKRDYLSKNGLTYKMYLEGVYEDEKVREKLKKKQLKSLSKVDKIRIYNISPSELLAESSSGLKYTTSKFLRPESIFGKTTKEYVSDETGKDFFSKIFLGIVFGYFTLRSFINADNIAQLIWQIFSLAVYLTVGMANYFLTKNYMLEEYRSSHIILKSDCLNEFVLMISKDENSFEEWDDMLLVKKKKREEREAIEKEELKLIEIQPETLEEKEVDEDGIDRGREVEETIETSDEHR